VGSAWALQGLWAAPWLTDVEGLDRKALIAQLLVMAVALGVGAPLMGTIADRMRRHGIGPQRLFVALVALFVAAQLTLILRLPVPSCLPWCVVAIVGAGTVLTYAIIAEFVPKELAGRGNAALNVFQLGWAFVVQYATGLILVQWPRHDGHYPVIAYQVAFSLNLAVQIAALAWFEWSRLRALGVRAICRVLGVSSPRSSHLLGRGARHAEFEPLPARLDSPHAPRPGPRARPVRRRSRGPLWRSRRRLHAG
jgi:MFS family permease